MISLNKHTYLLKNATLIILFSSNIYRAFSHHTFQNKELGEKKVFSNQFPISEPT